MRASTVVVSALSAAALIAAAAVAVAESVDLPLRFKARTEMARAENLAPEPARVHVVLNRFSTADEIAAQRAALEDKGPGALSRELSKHDLGTVKVDPGTTNVIGFATRVEAPWGEVIRIMTARPFLQPRAGGDYVGALEIRMPVDRAEGHGTIVPAAIIKYDEKGQPYADDAPLRTGASELVEVRRIEDTKHRN